MFRAYEHYLTFQPSELPDEYDMRIQTLLESIGGTETVRNLVIRYQARIAAVTMGIPTRTGDTVEDGYVSREMMKKLYDLGLDLHFYYT